MKTAECIDTEMETAAHQRITTCRAAIDMLLPLGARWQHVTHTVKHELKLVVDGRMFLAIADSEELAWKELMRTVAADGQL